MKIEILDIDGIRIGEIIADDIIIKIASDGLDILGNVYYQGADNLILYEENIAPEFFDLRTGIAGEILQKFSTYRVRLAIVGDFLKYKSKSLNDFIFESNQVGRISFVANRDQAISKLINAKG